jgi:hypothetical protein
MSVEELENSLVTQPKRIVHDHHSRPWPSAEAAALSRMVIVGMPSSYVHLAAGPVRRVTLSTASPDCYAVTRLAQAAIWAPDARSVTAP